MIDYIVYFEALLTATKIILKLFGVFWLVFGLLLLVCRFYFTPMRRFQDHCMYVGSRAPKPLSEWQEAATTEMVWWALTSNESHYFCDGDAIFRWQPNMAQEKKVWESLLTVKIERGFIHGEIGRLCLNVMLESYSYTPRLRLVHLKYIGRTWYEYKTEIMDESLLFRLFQSYAPPLQFADRDYMRRLCKNYNFGAKLLDASLNIDVYFLMELQQINRSLLECPTFRKNYQFATILEAWRQEIKWCEVHIDENFDPALWHYILAFIAFPEGIDLSLISRHMRIPTMSVKAICKRH